MTENQLDRFLAKVEIQSNGCWLWTASKRASGHGQFQLDARVYGRPLPAHRVSYEHYVGTIPLDMVIDHLCENPPCANPEHMEVVTHQENTRRYYARRDTCRKGHPRSDSYITNLGFRRCLACHRENERDRRNRRLLDREYTVPLR